MIAALNAHRSKSKVPKRGASGLRSLFAARVAIQPVACSKMNDAKRIDFAPILLQKSAVIDDVVRPVHLGRWGFPPPRRLYATFTLRNTQSPNGWRSRNQRCEPLEVLGDSSQNKFILGASRTTQSKPAELQDALQVREPHLDLLALTSRLLEALGASERPGDVPGALMYVARDLARWFFWTALWFERAYIAVELAGAIHAIQKRLALVHGECCPVT